MLKYSLEIRVEYVSTRIRLVMPRHRADAVRRLAWVHSWFPFPVAVGAHYWAGFQAASLRPVGESGAHLVVIGMETCASGSQSFGVPVHAEWWHSSQVPIWSASQDG